MTLNLNENTYVMPEDSNALLAEVLPTSNPLRVTWEVLSTDEQASYLAAAVRSIEAMNFTGTKAFFHQPLKFPRVARGIPVDFENAPLEVKRAQVLIAADIARDELYVRRRNTEVCVALGVAKITDTAQIPKYGVEKAKELLTRWITSWRRV